MEGGGLMKTCLHCHKYFRSKYENSKYCYDCYLKRERALAEHDGLLNDLANANCELNRLRLDRSKSPIAIKRINDLTKLCHPDKHPKEWGLANDVMQWLNDLRSKAS